MAIESRVICDASALADGGRAVVFSREFSGTTTACFAIRFQGEIHAFANHCPHRGTPLDWQPGEVFDDSGLYLICATHGALFEPNGGLCVAGPCQGMRLTPVPILQEGNQVILKVGRVLFSQVPETK